MYMSKFLDTNILLRGIIGDVKSQSDVFANLVSESAKLDQKLHIVSQVLFEMMYVLKNNYKTDKQNIIEAIRKVLAFNHIVFHDKSVFDLSLSIFETKNISIEDCYYIAHCIENNLELISFDKKAVNIYNSLKS